MWRCHVRKRFALSIGRSKKPSCSACLPEAEFSRKIVLVVGGASGIGREVALLLARKGAHIVVADFDEPGAQKVADEASGLSSRDQVASTKVDLGSAQSLARP